MPIIKLPSINSDEGLIEAKLALLAGQTLLLPTDTIYGLSCLANNEQAVRKIFAIKGRPTNKPLICLVNGLKMAQDLADIDAKTKAYLLSIWPGPVTVVLPGLNKLPAVVTGGLSTIALRWPLHNWLNKLITLVDQPIISTSANLAGQPPVINLTAVERYFINQTPDLVIDAGELNNEPSQIVDGHNLSEIKIIR